MNPRAVLADDDALAEALAEASGASRALHRDVVSVRTYSMSRMIGTGFMKCMPSTWSARRVAVAIWMTGIDDVLLARMACGGQTASSSSNVRLLISRFSVAASMTRSQSPKSSSDVVPVRAARGPRRARRRQLVAPHGRRQRLLDALPAAGQQVLVDLADDGRVAGPRAHLGDAGAHQPAADDAHGSYLHARGV